MGPREQKPSLRLPGRNQHSQTDGHAKKTIQNTDATSPQGCDPDAVHTNIRTPRCGGNQAASTRFLLQRHDMCLNAQQSKRAIISKCVSVCVSTSRSGHRWLRGYIFPLPVWSAPWLCSTALEGEPQRLEAPKDMFILEALQFLDDDALPFISVCVA